MLNLQPLTGFRVAVKIDDNGDVYVIYDILNWQLNETGEISPL